MLAAQHLMRSLDHTLKPGASLLRFSRRDRVASAAFCGELNKAGEYLLDAGEFTLEGLKAGMGSVMNYHSPGGPSGVYDFGGRDAPGPAL